MIDPIDEMREAFLAEREDACDEIGCGRPECLDVRLAAALAIVARTRCMEPRGHVFHPLARPEPPVEHRLRGEIAWNPVSEEFQADCVCGETISGWLRTTAEERLLLHLEREARP